MRKISFERNVIFEVNLPFHYCEDDRSFCRNMFLENVVFFLKIATCLLLFRQNRSLYLFKNLNATVTEVRHNYFTVTKNSCRERSIKLPHAPPRSSKLGEKLSTRLKYLNSVIPKITNHQVSCLVHGQTVRLVELPI